MSERRDNPWALVGLVILGVAAAIAGCVAWAWILAGVAR